METKIILGFPGTGKSFIVNNTDLSASDSDSSTFDKSAFPENYIEHIRSLIGKVEFVFVSTHAEVRKAIAAQGWKHFVVFPAVSEKEDYILRYKERGSSESFVKLMDSQFENFVNEIENEIATKTYPTAKYYRLRDGSTMADVVKKLYLKENISSVL